jgi:hypothetical protein|tara:strand:- start:663 stop:938 length:276 start_codon:yes stop_codon:yes gene_type:complete
MEKKMIDYNIIKKTKTRLKYKGIAQDILHLVRWYPKSYEPFTFDFDVVKTRMETARAAGYEDDVSTIKRNIKRVTSDNPGIFDEFLPLLEL